MEVSVQLHALAVLPPGKEYPSVHCIGGLVRPRAGLDAVEEKNCLPLPNPGRSAHGFTD
jgi:hypothetical protein